MLSERTFFHVEIKDELLKHSKEPANSIIKLNKKTNNTSLK